MGCYRVAKHVYDANWEDRNKHRTREQIEFESLFDDPYTLTDESEGAEEDEDKNEEEE